MHGNGQRLRELRELAGLTQSELGRRANVSESTISNLERDKVKPRADTALLLAGALELAGEERKRVLAWPYSRTSSMGRDACIDGRRWGGAPVYVPPTRLIGRDGELGELVDTICREDVRLATLTGPGGVGKTRTATRAFELAGSRFSGGCHAADLSAVPQDHDPAPAIGAALSPATAVREHTELSRMIGARHVLFLLDNVEQLPGAAPLIAHLLAECPRLTILATSRTPLGLRGEHRIRLCMLAVPEGKEPTIEQVLTTSSGQLFHYYAGMLSKDWDPGDDAAVDLARICRAVAGLPLSLELAAGWTETLTLKQIADRLDTPGRHLEILADSHRDGPARHKAITATIAGSVQLLTPGQRDLLVVLATRLPSAWTLDEAHTAARHHAPGIHVITELRPLVAHGLVNHSSTNGRYLITSSVREYVRTDLSGDDAARGGT
ncbi:helix-turn-helix domain-containing protein [Streptomyces sp. CG4]|uniref:helix-turn-helix domain-containing protein n=1 Tax=Streptomyces sp. CG4 TaxID=408783 RepID=UPI0034E19B35